MHSNVTSKNVSCKLASLYATSYSLGNTRAI